MGGGGGLQKLLFQQYPRNSIPISNQEREASLLSCNNASAQDKNANWTNILSALVFLVQNLFEESLYYNKCYLNVNITSKMIFQ